VSVVGEHTNGQFPLGSAKAPTAELVVDDEKTPLTTLPLPVQEGPVPIPGDGVLLVASVPRGAPVELAVTDEGVTQRVDLRTGERVESVEGYYGANAQELSFTTDVPVAFLGGAATLHVAASAVPEVVPKLAVRAPWTPGQGWAADGHAWLVVPRPVLSTPLMMDMTGLRLTVDDAAVFSVDGRPEIGGTRQQETLAAEFSPTTDPLVFDVPADFTGGTFTMNLAAMGVTAQFYTGDRAVTWTPPPAPVTVPLSFE
jgi:hypothetical protein